VEKVWIRVGVECAGIGVEEDDKSRKNSSVKATISARSSNDDPAVAVLKWILV
jgi:hypothetical protein